MGGQGYFCVEGRCDGTGKGFAVDIDFPTCCCIQLYREVQFGKAPDGQKIVKRDVGGFAGSLDVDDARLRRDSASRAGVFDVPSVGSDT